MTDEEKTHDGILPPMAANISDLLHQSFFLDQGFVGEYARQKILNLIDCLKGARFEDWNSDTASEFIKTIGEPFIKRQLTKMWEERYAKDYN